MQMIHKRDHPSIAAIIFLPMINLDPSDLTCINSMLHFVIDNAQRHNFTPVLIFDQPLWWKALSIVENSPINSKLRTAVLHLGGFYTGPAIYGKNRSNPRVTAIEIEPVIIFPFSWPKEGS